MPVSVAAMSRSQLGRAPDSITLRVRRTRLWQPNELPRVHTVDLTMDPADFQWQ